ncbi:HEPN domain-containing protein [Alteromonas lipolytica]|uniref:Uncharacterized protein n=1 Tax=Alteromonas lipolytica TaxID=1856405 RepID=A0A1E8FFD8_9ALTE|nr:HEPN domain-containing protein [Alteromonas lipolytica]OFI34203.1 hypothetical protein BFC17_21945 [Alteromonas lipolytica]GGF84159.1 hypothetical protein GCM10011338_40570 [Alteromonas lipolytica]
METSQKDLLKLIDLCRFDERFNSLARPMFSWRDWVVEQGVPEQTIKLMDTLLDDYPEVLERHWGTPNSFSLVTPFDLARWLCGKAREVGAEKALQLFLNFIKKTTVPLYVISLLEGVIPAQTYYFDEKTYLCSFDGLPEGVKERINICWQREYRDFNGEKPAFIVTKIECNVFNCDDDKGISRGEENQLFCIRQNHFLLSYFLSLYTEKFAACIIKEWCFFEESTPCSGFIDSNETSFLQVVRPFYSETLQFSDKHCMQTLVKKFRLLNVAYQDSIVLALKRKTSAMNAHDKVDAAIDLGMCAESILTKSERSEQLSLQVRLLGARLSSDNYEERVSHYNYLKAFYCIRSEAVHNAKIKEKYQVKYVGKVDAKIILNETSQILSRCVLEIIERGGMSDLDKELVFLK